MHTIHYNSYCGVAVKFFEKKINFQNIRRIIITNMEIYVSGCTATIPKAGPDPI